MIDNLTKVILGVIAVSTTVMALQGFFIQPTIIMGGDKIQRITLCNQYGDDCGVGANHYKPVVVGEYDIKRVQQRPNSFDY